MSQVAAIIAIGVIAAGMIVMLGAVQNARTRAMTRKRLGEAIPDMEPSHVIGTVSHKSTDERVRRATGELNVEDVKQALDEARSMEES